MARKKKDTGAASGNYRSETEFWQDYDPGVLEEREAYGKMSKAANCPQCGSKMTKGMCKCMGKGMAKGRMSKVTLPPKPGMPMPGMPNQPGRPRPPMPKPMPKPMPRMGGMGMNMGSMGMGKAQGAYIDGKKAPEQHPTKMSKGETCAQCGSKFTKRGLCKCGTMGKAAGHKVDKKLVMFNTRKGMMSKRGQLDLTTGNMNPGRMPGVKPIRQNDKFSGPIAGFKPPRRPNDKFSGNMAPGAPKPEPVRGRPPGMGGGSQYGPDTGIIKPKPIGGGKPPFKGNPGDPIRITDGPILRDKFPGGGGKTPRPPRPPLPPRPGPGDRVPGPPRPPRPPRPKNPGDTKWPS